MNAIRIHTRIESDTLHLPELRPLVGKRVEIIILEEQPVPIAGYTPGTGDWEAAEKAARELRESGFDFDFYARQKEYERQVVKGQLP